MVSFPVDEAHAAFVLSVFEELGIGRDFGSVLVLPVAGGEASYVHLVRLSRCACAPLIRL